MNLKTTIEVTNPVVCVDLHIGDAGWRALQEIRRHACLKAKPGSLHHVGFFFWLGLTGVTGKAGCQVSLTTVKWRREKHKAG